LVHEDIPYLTVHHRLTAMTIRVLCLHKILNTVLDENLEKLIGRIWWKLMMEMLV